MTFALRAVPGTKPLSGAQIDATHPLAAGLTICLPLTEYGSGKVTELVGQNVVAVPSDWTWTADGGGALKVPAASTNSMAFPFPQWASWGAQAESGSAFVLLKGSNNTDAIVFYLLTDFAAVTVDVGVGLKLRSSQIGTVNGYFVQDSTAETANTWLALGQSYDASLAVANEALNGAAGVTTSGLTGSTGSRPATLTWFGPTATGAATATYTVACIYLWSGRALSLAELQSLTQDPYQFLRPPLMRRAFPVAPPVSASGAFTLNPWLLAASVSEIESETAAFTLSTWQLAAQESYETASAGLTLNAMAFAASVSEIETETAAFTLNKWVLAGQESYETGSAGLTLSSWLLAASVSEVMAATAALTLSTLLLAAQESYETASAPLTLSSWLVAATASELMTAAAALTLSRWLLAASAAEIEAASGAFTLSAWLLAAAASYETASGGLTLSPWLLAAPVSEVMAAASALTLSRWLLAAAVTVAATPVTGVLTLNADTFTLLFNGALTLAASAAALSLSGASVSGRLTLAAGAATIALVGAELIHNPVATLTLAAGSATIALAAAEAFPGTLSLRAGSANAPLLHLVAPHVPDAADVLSLASVLTASRTRDDGGAVARIVPRTAKGEPLTNRLPRDAYARVTLRRATGGDTVETTGRFESGPDGISIVAVWPDALPWVGLYYVFVEAEAQRCPTLGYVPVLVEA